MVTAVGVVGCGVEARLVVSDADPGGDVVGINSERVQLACQFTALVDARVRERDDGDDPCDATHRCVYLTDRCTRTLFYVSHDLPPRSLRGYVCRARILTVILIVFKYSRWILEQGRGQ